MYNIITVEMACRCIDLMDRNEINNFLLPARSPAKSDNLSPILKMPYCGKIADELLLGLSYDTQDRCFPDFELLNDGEKFDLRTPEPYTDIRSYMELIDINGKRHSFRPQF